MTMDILRQDAGGNVSLKIQFSCIIKRGLTVKRSRWSVASVQKNGLSQVVSAVYLSARCWLIHRAPPFSSAIQINLRYRGGA